LFPVEELQGRRSGELLFQPADPDVDPRPHRRKAITLAQLRGPIPKENPMRERSFDTLAIHTDQSLSRRASLLGLGAAALAAALAKPTPARAGKASKKAKKACRRQVAACEEATRAVCIQQFPDPGQQGECIAVFVPCCQPFGGCQSRDALQCVFNIFAG
jgi:hypothetical protein